jgi:predicted double-glycine peptidase
VFLAIPVSVVAIEDRRVPHIVVNSNEAGVNSDVTDEEKRRMRLSITQLRHLQAFTG